MSEDTKQITELFRACADAERIAERLVGNYARKANLQYKDWKEEIPEVKKKTLVQEGVHVTRKPYRGR